MGLVDYIVLSVSLVIFGQALFSIYLMLYTWEHPERFELSKGPGSYLPPRLSFSVILPARHEEAVIAQTIRQVWAANYPKELLEVVVVCHRYDAGTIAEAERTVRELGSDRVRVETFAEGPINKPRGLNVGLQRTTNEVVTIFDAEDDIDPDIFNIVNTVMHEEEIGIVQAGVQLMNFRDHWYSVHNCLEYYFYFKSRLHFHAKVGMIPLGGNTVFILRDLINRVGGWDENCLTEDADIGLRLSALGERIRVVYDAQHVTREETPDSVASFVRQRTRWNQGFLQIMRKGSSWSLARLSQKLLAAYTLGYSVFQALVTLLWPFAIVGVFLLKVPVVVAIVSFLPLYVLLLQLLANLVGAFAFVKEYELKAPLLMPVQMAVTFLPYQLLLGFSALRAMYRDIRNHDNWEKTAHVGAHRRSETAFPTVYERLLEEAFASLGAERGSVMVFDHEQGSFSIRASKGLPDDVADTTRVNPGGGVAEWVARHRIPVVINGGRDLPDDLRARLNQPELVSSVVLPVERDGEVAVVSLSSKVSSFDHEDLRRVGTSMGAAETAPEKPIVGIPESRRHGMPSARQLVRAPRHKPSHMPAGGRTRPRAVDLARRPQSTDRGRTRPTGGRNLPSLAPLLGRLRSTTLLKIELPFLSLPSLRLPGRRSLVLGTCLLVCGFAATAALAGVDPNRAADAVGAPIVAVGETVERVASPSAIDSNAGEKPGGSPSDGTARVGASPVRPSKNTPAGSSGQAASEVPSPEKEGGECGGAGTRCLIKLARKEAPQAEYVGGRIEFDGQNRKRNVLYFIDPTVERCESIELQGVANRNTEYLMVIAREDYYGERDTRTCAAGIALNQKVGGVHVG